METKGGGQMKKCILMCIVVLFGCFACVSATKTTVLKPGMPNTLKLSNGEVVYDLSGEWDISSKTTLGASYGGLLEITQDEDRFVGTLKSGNYPMEGSEKVKGKLKGGEVANIQYKTTYGWTNSSGEIAEGGKMMTIFTSLPEGGTADTTLRKK